jgi:light-regulated signal transduction histidine kinase (bacteriophytochrome)
MGELIDGILHLSRVTRGELARDDVDLSALARTIAAELERLHPDRRLVWRIADGLRAHGDRRMLAAMLRNLLDNAVKYSAGRDPAEISLFAESEHGITRFHVADNGAGFDMACAGQLFRAFQRLHRQEEFPGLGIGLATVQRIVHRHGGDIRAEGRVGQGADFSFTLGAGDTEPAP